MTNMPKVNIISVRENFLSTEEVNILGMVVKKDDTIRASKPKVKDGLTGKAAYVWRMVCFQVSPKGQHHCMPTTANFDLPAYDENGDWKCAISRGMEKELDKLVDMIVNAVDKTEWHGIQRWGKALGY